MSHEVMMCEWEDCGVDQGQNVFLIL
jgi:hypothetical protein